MKQLTVPLVVAHRLRVTLGGRTALDGVDLVVHEGAHLAVLGPNGAGKSTLLRALRGQMQPDMRHGGRLLWRAVSAPDGGVPVSGQRRHAGQTDQAGKAGQGGAHHTPGLSSQTDAGTSAWADSIHGVSWQDTIPASGHVHGMDDAPLTGRALAALVSAAQQEQHVRRGWNITGEELVLGGLFDTPMPYEEPTPEQHARLAPLMARLDAHDLMHTAVPSLSQGQLRLLLVARALIRAPRLLLLDEVCDGLDAMARARVLYALTQAADMGTTLVVAAHRAVDLPECVVDGIRLHAGRIVARGPATSLLASEETHATPPPGIDAGTPPHPDPDTDTEECSGQSAETSPRKVGTPDTAHPAPPDRHAGTRPGARQGGGHDDRSDVLSDEEHDGGQDDILVQVSNATVFVERTPVLHNVDWTIRRGEQWLVAGPNGAGKSTLLRLLAGEEFAAAGGDVRLMPRTCGEAARGLMALRRHVSIVSDRLQATYAYDVSVEDCVLSGVEGTIGLYEQPSPEEHDRAMYWMDILGITHLAGRHIRSLSTGQARRVFLARALTGSPVLLLLDEPCSGLDDANRHALLQTLGALTRHGVHLVLVTHHEADIIPETTHRLQLEAGRVVHAGPWDPRNDEGIAGGERA